MGDYLEEWLWSKQSLRPSTHASYETHVRRYLIPHLGNVSIDALLPLHIERMYRELATQEGRGGRPLAVSSVRRIHATLMSALNMAVRRGPGPLGSPALPDVVWEVERQPQLVEQRAKRAVRRDQSRGPKVRPQPSYRCIEIGSRSLDETAGQRPFYVSARCLNSSMSSQPIEHLHPVLDFAHRLVARLDSLAAAPLMSMRPEDKRAALVTLARGRAQLDALALRLLADAEQSEATVESGAGTAADWVAVETRQVRREARADLRLAKNLETHEVLASAMAAGQVNLAQGRAIIASLDRLPRTGQFAVSAEQRTEAESHLVQLAAEHDAKALRVLGRRVFEVIAPDLAEQFEGKALEREEAEALRRTTLTMWEDDEGTCHGRFRLPALHGQMLTKMILAISSPARATGAVAEAGAQSGIDPDLPTPVRHGIALTQLLESVQASDLPRTGGCGATVVVTMTLGQLMAKLDTAGVCTLDTGGRISATEARRLACSAGIIPIVLGGRGQVLDVGRKRRLHTEAMRLAMGVRDGGCTAVDCELPPGLCHAHHDIAWADGGRTNAKTGRLICPHHHRRIHDPRYETKHLPSGKVSFHRRE